jgi:small subunit ribosomal protein S20
MVSLIYKEITVANHKSSKKRARQTVKKTAANRTKESAVKTAVKAVRDAITKKDAKTAQTLFVRAQSLLNKLAKINVIKKGAASRKVSRLAAQISKM